MKPMGHIAVVAGLVVMTNVAVLSADVVSERDAALRCRVCEPKISIPFVRAAVVQTAMYTASASIWPEAYSPFLGKENVRQFKESWSSPPEYHFTPNVLASDNDWWYFNLIMHGLFGSEMYLAARDWGRGPVGAVLFAIFASTAWEYLIESWTKQPSAVDLFFTPAFGVLLGELRYQAVRAAYRMGNKPLSRTLRILVDPLGELERTLLGCRLK
jgi:hypothetical protein